MYLTYCFLYNLPILCALDILEMVVNLSTFEE